MFLPGPSAYPKPLPLGSPAREASTGRRTLERFCSGNRAVGWRPVALHEAGSNLFLRLVVPHLGFGEQSPTLKRPKHRALTAKGFHCAVANEVFHCSRLQPPCPPNDLKRISRQSHYDSDEGVPISEKECAGGLWNPFGRRQAFLKDGIPTGEYRDFVTGFVIDDSRVWGRPVGVAVAHDGALLVSEDGNGTIWRVTH